MGEVVVGAEFDPEVVGLNRKTMEPLRPPVRIHITCDESQEGIGRALLNAIAQSRGWRCSDTYVKPLYTEGTRC